jgi:hypothetical protein
MAHEWEMEMLGLSPAQEVTDAELPVVVRLMRQALRRSLGCRPETRLDVVILPNGVSYRTSAAGILVRVR